MKPSYDFSNSKKNPYANKLKRQISIRIDQDTIDYFKGMSAELGVPYQSLINLYLKDCAQKKKRLKATWA